MAVFFPKPWWGDLFLVYVADFFLQTFMEWPVFLMWPIFSSHLDGVTFFNLRARCFPPNLDGVIFFSSRGRFFPHTLLDWPFFFIYVAVFFASKPWWSDLFFVYMADFSSNLHGVTFFRIQIAIIKALNWQYWLNQKLGFTIMILVDVAGFSSKPSWSDPFFLMWPIFSSHLDGVTFFKSAWPMFSAKPWWSDLF